MLLRADQPRFQMSVIVLATGAFGFLASYVLLHLGLSSMSIRYPLAVGLAYLIFLGMLRLWLAYQGRRLDDRSSFLDIIDLGGSLGASVGLSTPKPFMGEGGSFGGAGASASFDDAASAASVESSASWFGGSGEVISNATDAGSIDLDELWLIVLALFVLISGAVLAFYVIYIAPALFAEILVDGVLVAGLYRRLHGPDTQHWLKVAVKRTWLPVTSMATIFAIGGLLMQKLVPEARTIADLFP